MIWSGLSILTRLAIVAGTIAALAIGAFSAWEAHGLNKYNEGWNAAIAKIAEKDKEAVDAVKKKTQQVDNCYANGGNWDSTRGVCH